MRDDWKVRERLRGENEPFHRDFIFILKGLGSGAEKAEKENEKAHFAVINGVF